MIYLFLATSELVSETLVVRVNVLHYSSFYYFSLHTSSLP
jgi:hypothetical protein